MSHYFYALAFICLSFASCSDNDEIWEEKEVLTLIGLTNWTGHWDALCSPGEKLTFSINHKEKVQRFDIEADSSVGFWADMEEGDLIKIVITNEKGDIIHSRSKNFEPSDPERPASSLNMVPSITVCQIDRLDVEGF